MLKLTPQNNRLIGNYGNNDIVFVECDAATAAFTVDLPEVESLGPVVFSLKKTDSSLNAVTINGTIDGESSHILDDQYDSVMLIPFGNTYHVLFMCTNPELVANGSFELGVNPPVWMTENINSGITSWTIDEGRIDWLGNYWEPKDLLHSIDLNGLTQSGSIYQDITLVVGRIYKISFWMAGNPEGGAAIKTMNMLIDGNTESYSFDTTGYTIENMGWEYHEFSFTYTGVSNRLRFRSTMASGAYGIALDLVSVR